MGSLDAPLPTLTEGSRAGFAGIDLDATGQAGDPVQDTWVALGIVVRGNVIATARYEVFGCPHTMAAVAWVAESLEGDAVSQLGAIDVAGLKARFEVPRERFGRLLLIEDAASACLRAWQERKG